MPPGIGDRFKKIVKAVDEAERTVQQAQAIMHGGVPPMPPSTSRLAPAAAPGPPPNVRCSYCGGSVVGGSTKCPNCSAPIP